MNNALNTRLNNINTKQGSVANYFANLKQLVQVNDGTRSFCIRTRDCRDQAAPFTSNQLTTIDITHGDHMISQLSDGFLTAKITLSVKITGIDNGNSGANFHDTNNITKVFIGLKSSNQLWDEMDILNRDVSTGYHNQEMTREGFAYSTPMHKQEKKTKRFTHSLYENVQEYSTSVCGTYVNIEDFKDGAAHDVQMEINIPFDHLLALQAFDLYPNSICGNLALKGYLRARGFVWCMVNPMAVKEYKEFIQGEDFSTFTFPGDIAGLYKHEFTQAGNSAAIITKWTESSGTVTAVSGEATVLIQGMRVERLTSTMYGFSVEAESLNKIATQFSTPVIIPSQQLIYNAFPLAATTAGIQTTINMPVSNCSNMSVVFPKYENDMTVFTNPVYQNLQLIVDGKSYPDEAVSSMGAQFLQQQLIASDLSAGLECTKEFEDSYIMDKNTSSGTRYTNTLRDGSSFMWNVQLERANAGYTFDGVDSHGQNIAIQLKGQPIFTSSGANHYDTYYDVDASGTKHPPPPQLWLCCDTYFEVSSAGVKYVHNQTPDGY